MKTKNKKYNFTVHAFEKVLSFQTEKTTTTQPTIWSKDDYFVIAIVYN